MSTPLLNIMKRWVVSSTACLRTEFQAVVSVFLEFTIGCVGRTIFCTFFTAEHILFCGARSMTS